MMKYVNKYLLIVLVLCLICLKNVNYIPENNTKPAPIARRQNRKNNDSIIEQYEDALPNEFSDLTDVDKINGSIGIDELLGACINAIRGNGTAVLHFLLLSLSLSAITALCAALCNDVYTPAARGASLIALFALIGSLMPMVDEVALSISKISDFLLSLVPVFSAISVSRGHVAVASSQATGMSLTLSFFGGEGANALVTVVKCLFVLAVLSVFTKEGGKLMNTIKSIFLWGLGIITTLLGGIISVQTLISRAADNATVTATKYAVSNMLPIAGGAVSGALSTLISGMSYYASVVGGGAIAVVVLCAIAPLVTLLMYKLALSVVMIFTSFIDSDVLDGGVKAISGALDSLIALYSVTVVIYALEIMLFLHQ